MGAQLTRELTALGSAIELVAAVGYCYGILRGKSRPHPVSWFVWAIILAAGLSSSILGGANEGVAVIGILLVVELVVGFLSLRPRFANENIAWYDVPLAAMAIGATLAAWKYNFPPFSAVLVAITADALAVLPTIRAHWHKPEDQAWPWFLGSIALTISAVTVALKSTAPAALAFPVYLAVTNFVIVWVMLGRPKKVAHLKRRRSKRRVRVRA